MPSPGAGRSELRKDPIVGRWVILAPERSERPRDYEEASPPRRERTCPFCPGNEDETTPEVLAYREPGTAADAPGWRLRVVPNKYPALRLATPLERRDEGLIDTVSGFGAHEVVVETPHHDRSLADLEVEAVADVLRSFRERVQELARDQRLRYVLVFENRGAAAGATLEHPHAQIIATPILPKRVHEEMEGALRYYESHERCVFCDIVEQERRAGERGRLVSETEGFLVLEPYAPRFPYETWILPGDHETSFEKSSDGRVAALARALRGTLRRLDRALDRPAYNYVLHTAPCRSPRLEHYHWHLEIMPMVSRIAGFEWGTGFYINHVPPEEAARRLRRASPEAESGLEAESSARSATAGDGFPGRTS